MMIQSDELIFFRGVAQPPTSHELWWNLYYGVGSNQLKRRRSCFFTISIMKKWDVSNKSWISWNFNQQKRCIVSFTMKYTNVVENYWYILGGFNINHMEPTLSSNKRWILAFRSHHSFAKKYVDGHGSMDHRISYPSISTNLWYIILVEIILYYMVNIWVLYGIIMG